jgi:hypothetical protein
MLSTTACPVVPASPVVDASAVEDPPTAGFGLTSRADGRDAWLQDARKPTIARAKRETRIALVYFVALAIASAVWARSSAWAFSVASVRREAAAWNLRATSRK